MTGEKGALSPAQVLTCVLACALDCLQLLVCAQSGHELG
jgi:hypothetical protein